MSSPRFHVERRFRRAMAAFGALLAIVAAAPASASPGPRPLSGGSLLGLHVDLGCANPANRLSLGKLVPAARVLVGGTLRCFSQAIAAGAGEGPKVTPGPTGLGPSQIRSAYKLAGLRAGGRTVAIVDAYNDPNAESDLAAYRSAYGLPACTAANHCFTKVNQAGAPAPLPSGDAGWGTEISLDLDAVSAACPDCRIVLVEANSAGTADLMAAERTAAAWPGVAAVTNSWGGAEDNTIVAAGQQLQPSRPGDHGELGRLGLRRQLAGVLAVRHGRRRDHADGGRGPPRLERGRLVGRRQRLLVL